MPSNTILPTRLEINPIQPLLHSAALAALYETESSTSTNESQYHHPISTARVSILDQLKVSGNHGFVCQTAQGHVLGAVTLFNNPYQPGTVILANLVTDQRVRRRGVGRSLLQHVITFTKKHFADFLALQVEYDNAPAIRLYESFGFERMGEVQELSLPAQSLKPTNTVIVREAQKVDATEIQRLTRLAIPNSLRFADAVDPNQHLLPQSRVVGKSQSESNPRWVVAPAIIQRGLIGITRLERTPNVASSDLSIKVFLDPKTTVTQGVDFVAACINHVGIERLGRITTTQSSHAVTAVRVLEQLGFRIEHTMLHMRLPLQ